MRHLNVGPHSNWHWPLRGYPMPSRRWDRPQQTDQKISAEESTYQLTFNNGPTGNP